MRQPFILLVIATFGLPSPVLAQATTAKADIADFQVTDNACIAGDFAAMSALIKEDERRRGDITAPGPEQPQSLLVTLGEMQAEADDRAYLQETAWTSATMTKQGPQLAIARLNPWFAARLAGAIRDARGSGLPTAGIYSAYRPPAFGVGRFLDRFVSLHAYGLAVDMRGIGSPGSTEAKLWYDIAERHGVVCPYGVNSRREWNHCQATAARAVCRDNPLRNTITAEGPIDLNTMFRAGNVFADNPPASCAIVVADRPANAEGLTHLTHHRASAVSIAAAMRSGRRHWHPARNVLARGTTGAASSSGETSMRMVAHDMQLGTRPNVRLGTRRFGMRHLGTRHLGTRQVGMRVGSYHPTRRGRR